MLDLSGKVAVVTGGNRGIGLGYARGLAKAGAAVAIWARDETRSAEAVAELEQLGSRAVAVACDVTSEESVASAMDDTLERLGRLDAVFANAGIGAAGTRFTDMSLEEWNQIVTVNLTGAFLTLREAVRRLLDQGEGGSLVATSSISARFGTPRGEHYAATKTALYALVQGIAVEHGRHGIRANGVMPGWVATEMTAEAFANPRFEQAVLPRHPLGRWGDPADFEGIAAYLASDASRWHTGDVIRIDGGYSVF